jgi:hypothetical protein
MTTTEITYGTANMSGNSNVAFEDCPWAHIGQARR